MANRTGVGRGRSRRSALAPESELERAAEHARWLAREGLGPDETFDYLIDAGLLDGLADRGQYLGPADLRCMIRNSPRRNITYGPDGRHPRSEAREMVRDDLFLRRAIELDRMGSHPAETDAPTPPVEDWREAARSRARELYAAGTTPARMLEIIVAEGLNRGRAWKPTHVLRMAQTPARPRATSTHRRVLTDAEVDEVRRLARRWPRWVILRRYRISKQYASYILLRVRRAHAE